MSRRNGDRRLRMVRQRIRSVPLKKFRQANRLLTIEVRESTDHWGPTPPSLRYYQLHESKKGEVMS